VGQAILEQIAVRKVSQQIEVGLVGEPLEQRLALDRVAMARSNVSPVSLPLTQKSCAP
jgi:hypothetical protein